MTRKHLRRLVGALAGTLLLFVAAGVWVAQQFPALTNGPKSSVEMLEVLFKNPVRTVVSWFSRNGRVSAPR